jgi:hypothetical protein
MLAGVAIGAYGIYSIASDSDNQPADDAKAFPINNPVAGRSSPIHSGARIETERKAQLSASMGAQVASSSPIFASLRETTSPIQSVQESKANLPADSKATEQMLAIGNRYMPSQSLQPPTVVPLLPESKANDPRSKHYKPT